MILVCMEHCDDGDFVVALEKLTGGCKACDSTSNNNDMVRRHQCCRQLLENSREILQADVGKRKMSKWHNISLIESIRPEFIELIGSILAWSCYE